MNYGFQILTKVYEKNFTVENILKTIKRLKNGKEAGPYTVPAKALKVNGEINADMLLTLFKMILENEDTGKKGS